MPAKRRSARAERDIAVRKQELGAVELPRAAVERREETASERDSTLARIAARADGAGTGSSRTRRNGSPSSDGRDRKPATRPRREPGIGARARAPGRRPGGRGSANARANWPNASGCSRPSETTLPPVVRSSPAPLRTSRAGSGCPGEATAAPLDLDGHILYVAAADGYRIVECDGPAPVFTPRSSTTAGRSSWRAFGRSRCPG